jgi:uncharacterized protein YndB with AHSA1/START domain
MKPAVTTIEIARTPQDVFAYVTDPTRFPEWQKDVVRVRMEGDRAVGSRFVTTRRIAGAEREQTQEITEMDPPRRWAARGIDGPVRAHASIAVEPLDEGARSRVTFALDFEGHGVGVPLMPLVRRQYQNVSPRSYRNLTTLLEGRAADRRSG